MESDTIIENIHPFQKWIDIEENERTNQERCLPYQKKRFVPIEEILKSETACRKGIEDLKVKDHQENCQYFIFKDKTSFIDKEEHWKDNRNEKADDGQKGKKVQGHIKTIWIR